MSEIRELAMRLAMEYGFRIEIHHERGYSVITGSEPNIECLVRAAMRETYARAAKLCEAPEGYANEHYQVIRAEADKLEGK